MSSFDPSSPSPSKSRRRLATWAAFGIAGLATGAVWASGFVSATGANDSTTGSPALTKTTPAAATNALAGKVTKVNDLAFDWEGRWGSISADIHMFKVDLTGAAYAGKTYNVAVLLANTSDLSGWATMQLEIEREDLASATADCSTADYDGSQNPEILNSDNEDAGIYYNALPGDAVYCIGVSSTTGDDLAGTFLRAAQDTPPTAWPTFIATLDRAS